MKRTRQSGIPDKPEPTMLLISHEEAKGKLDQQIDKGNELLKENIQNPEVLDEAEKRKWKWHSYTVEMLKRMFTTEEISIEFSHANLSGVAMAWSPSFGHDLKSHFDSVKTYVHSLDSIKERIELIPTTVPSNTTATKKHSSANSRTVFVVHGHDDAARESVCRYLERLELSPTVLHEKANEGKTIIEKFETNADVGFAVVLLTPDDEGKSNTEEKLKSRARQNVVFEMGYFIGALGRSKVCCLYKKGVEIPSDYSGVIYTEMDQGGGWKLLLAKEIKASGIDIDMNKAL